MWTITGLQVRGFGQTPGGDQFTRLVDATIRAHAAVNKLAEAEIRTNLRTNLPDGGVDTQVDKGISGDTVGWMDVPAIFQYKAMERKKALADVKDDLAKPADNYAKECIRKGYAYRLCICDEITAKEITEYEDELHTVLKNISSGIARPKVLGASDIAAWLSKFPALVIQYFQPQLTGSVLHLGAWRLSIRAVTPEYIVIDTWKSVQEGLARHLNWTEEVLDVVFPIQGSAGVGKTRTAFEAINLLKGAEGLVIYVDDEEHAVNMARILANDPSLKAILVADECSLSKRQQIASILRGQRDRVRIVTIDNSGERPFGEAPEHLLPQMSSDLVDKVLEVNFGQVHQDRRRAYASLSGGFIRLAADMCAQDQAIAAAGHVGPAVQNVRDYLRGRFHGEDSEELKALEALALLDKVGFKEDVREELSILCSILDLQEEAVRSTLNRLHDAPGFVQRAGRYMYVTPEIIAQVSFEGAWRRWGEQDPAYLMERLSSAPELLRGFLKRVSRSARGEVRALVGEFFRRSVSSLRPSDLAEMGVADYLKVFAETDPATFLPLLRRLIGEASHDELLNIRGGATDGRWGPRRQLVWLCERLAAFPQFFADAEVVLRQLAAAESEPSIGNNATKIWCQFFRVVLSGTPIHFEERLRLLGEFLRSEDQATLALSLAAFESLLDPHPSRMTGPSVIAGMLPPPEWRPGSPAEYRSCFEAALSLASTVSLERAELIGPRLKDLVADNLRMLLSLRLLERIQEIFKPRSLSTELRLKVIKGVEDALRYDLAQASSDTNYQDQVRKWLATLMPRDFGSRLITAVSQDSWRSSVIGTEDAWSGEIRDLAGALLQDEQLFEAHSEWLTSPEAKSAAILGRDMGDLDATGRYLKTIVSLSQRRQSYGLARGYLSGLIAGANESLIELTNDVIDAISDEYPGLAFSLAEIGGTKTRSLERAMELFDRGLLQWGIFQAFLFGIDSQPLQASDYRAILSGVMKAVQEGDPQAIRFAVEFVAYRLRDEGGGNIASILTDHDIREDIWKLLAIVVGGVSGSTAYWFSEILRFLLPTDPARATDLAVSAALSDDVSLGHEVASNLVEIAAVHPEEAMIALGRAILDENQRWKFYIGNFKGVIQVLPPEVVIDWLRKHDAEAAVYIARHAPSPYLGPGETPEVPQLTEFLLTHFEDSDRVFHEFSAGVNNMKMYVGDIAGEHDQEAHLAQKFLNHPLRRIREWAEAETVSATAEARQWREREAERELG